MSNPDNIFDDDNALDYIIYKDCEKEVRNQQKGNGGRGGCLGLLLLLVVPVGLLTFFWPNDN
ncbi:MAG: hypothetical protein K0A99_09950 [Desulfoarculaceae bacterium]|nr:hypothetical protein [Desulfoarculaceae bacterium]